MYATKLDEVLFPVQSVPCYVITSRNKKSLTMADLSYAGDALFDFYKNSALRVEKGSFPFVSNEDLIVKFKLLVGGGNIEWRIIYYNNDKTDFYLNGIVKEWRGLLDSKGTLLKSSVELSNSYTGRFSPRVLYSLYNPVLKVFIKTPQSFGSTETLGRKTYQQIYPEFIESFKEANPLEVDVEVENLTIGTHTMGRYPLRVRDFFTESLGTAIAYYGQSIPISEVKLFYLTVVALTAHKWSATNYEHSRELQHHLYSRIMRLMPDQDYLKQNIYLYTL